MKINNSFYHSIISGIILEDTNDSLIYKNDFQHTRNYGIWMSSGKNNKISSNRVSESEFGVFLWKAHNSLTVRNGFIANQKDFCMKESNDNIILQNDFMNKRFYKNQFAFFDCDNNTWDNNYWGRARLHPKYIFGKNQNNQSVTGLYVDDSSSLNIDYHPVDRAYMI